MYTDKRARITGVRSEAVWGFFVCCMVFDGEGVAKKFRSGRDGKHSSKSLHYSGSAFDFPVDLDPDKRERLVQSLRNALTVEFDVVDEIDHIHVEFQPKEA